MTTATEPTLLEELHALEVTAHRPATERDDAVAERTDLAESNRQLRAERDAAFQMAAQATKDLVRERRESEGRLKVRDALIDSLRINADRTNADVRRLSARVRELAVENEDLRARSERDQREPPTVRKNWRSRRIGNQL